MPLWPLVALVDGLKGKRLEQLTAAIAVAMAEQD